MYNKDTKDVRDMDFIKKNKFTIIAIICFLLVMLIAIEVKNVFFPSGNNAIYGDRLDGKEDVPVNTGKIADKINENEIVKEAKVEINGKIINILITINDEVSLEDAKALTGPVLESLKEKQQKFYDVEVMIDKENDSTQFPIIGYKHHSKKDFVFTKDREEQETAPEAES